MTTFFIAITVFHKGTHHGRIQKGDRGSDLLKNHKNIRFVCNTGPDLLKNHKATKPALMLGYHWPTSVALISPYH